MDRGAIAGVDEATRGIEPPGEEGYRGMLAKRNDYGKNGREASVLSKLLVSRRSVDLIIYDFALDTILLLFEVANADVVEFVRLIVARIVVSIAQASGSGWFEVGAEVSPEQKLVIKSICSKLALSSSLSAGVVLEQLKTEFDINPRSPLT